MVNAHHARWHLTRATGAPSLVSVVIAHRLGLRPTACTARGVASADLLGWISSCVLVGTLAHQVRKQWREGRSEGVSPWLFVGQVAASTGFLAYSALVRNWVFTVTNALLVLNSILGWVITVRQRRSKGATAGRDARGATTSADARASRDRFPRVSTS